ncbi:DUF5906 domain-containing protein [Microbulbifer sp. HZ11]|uniref:DUF5906 domain-containing protein n=1 Tax=Microbulbifer sp. HZ11 TaxID=1453501 RepID=UPI000690DF9D|nr:DUF5906 domain-containing protein [Microbulbifer sp. HZ11]
MTTENKKDQGLDFNDIHCRHGLGEVRRQWDQFISRVQAGADNVIVFPHPSQAEAAPVPGAPPLDDIPPEYSESEAAESPAPSVVAEAREITFEDALKRFALISGTTKVWDEHLHRELKAAAFRAEVGPKVCKEFMDSTEKRKVLELDVKRFIAARQAAHKGAGGVGEMLERFTYLEVSDTAWDAKRRTLERLQDIRHAYPDSYDIWYKHPDRRMVDKENLVFDPSRQVDPDTHINMFRGLPLKPKRDDKKCRHIRHLLWQLCNEDNEVWEWLIRWLAYPLQHLGSKMASAVLMHSSVHGSGKSLFFDVVMRAVYGEYSRTLGQQQMEGQYTDWMSNLLYGVFEEIFSRSSKYSHQGSLKQMITGKTVRIEKKFVSGWEEANYMNAVFLSNEILPFPVEGSDRRFLVVWPEKKLSEELKKAVPAELEYGGAEAFYAWLLAVDLGDFHPHTEPPVTAAKQSLIDFGLPSWERFLKEWKAEELDVPYCSCLTNDLFVAYAMWCKESYAGSPLRRDKFLENAARELDRKPNRYYDSPGGFGKPPKKSVTGTFFFVHEQPHDKTQHEWLSECVKYFRDHIGAFAEVTP